MNKSNSENVSFYDKSCSDNSVKNNMQTIIHQPLHLSSHEKSLSNPTLIEQKSNNSLEEALCNKHSIIKLKFSEMKHGFENTNISNDAMFGPYPSRPMNAAIVLTTDMHNLNEDGDMKVSIDKSKKSSNVYKIDLHKNRNISFKLDCAMKGKEQIVFGNINPCHEMNLNIRYRSDNETCFNTLKKKIEELQLIETLEKEDEILLKTHSDQQIVLENIEPVSDNILKAVQKELSSKKTLTQEDIVEKSNLPLRFSEHNTVINENKREGLRKSIDKLLSADSRYEPVKGHFSFSLRKSEDQNGSEPRKEIDPAETINAIYKKITPVYSTDQSSTIVKVEKDVTIVEEGFKYAKDGCLIDNKIVRFDEEIIKKESSNTEKKKSLPISVVGAEIIANPLVDDKNDIQNENPHLPFVTIDNIKEAEHCKFNTNKIPRSSHSSDISATPSESLTLKFDKQSTGNLIINEQPLTEIRKQDGIDLELDRIDHITAISHHSSVEGKQDMFTAALEVIDRKESLMENNIVNKVCDDILHIESDDDLKEKSNVDDHQLKDLGEQKLASITEETNIVVFNKNSKNSIRSSKSSGVKIEHSESIGLVSTQTQTPSSVNNVQQVSHMSKQDMFTVALEVMQRKTSLKEIDILDKVCDSILNLVSEEKEKERIDINDLQLEGLGKQKLSLLIDASNVKGFDKNSKNSVRSSKSSGVKIGHSESIGLVSMQTQTPSSINNVQQPSQMSKQDMFTVALEVMQRKASLKEIKMVDKVCDSILNLVLEEKEKEKLDEKDVQLVNFEKQNLSSVGEVSNVKGFDKNSKNSVRSSKSSGVKIGHSESIGLVSTQTQTLSSLHNVQQPSQMSKQDMFTVALEVMQRKASLKEIKMVDKVCDSILNLGSDEEVKDIKRYVNYPLLKDFEEAKLSPTAEHASVDGFNKNSKNSVRSSKSSDIKTVENSDSFKLKATKPQSLSLINDAQPPSQISKQDMFSVALEVMQKKESLKEINIVDKVCNNILNLTSDEDVFDMKRDVNGPLLDDFEAQKLCSTVEPSSVKVFNKDSKNSIKSSQSSDTKIEHSEPLEIVAVKYQTSSLLNDIRQTTPMPKQDMFSVALEVMQRRETLKEINIVDKICNNILNLTSDEDEMKKSNFEGPQISSSEKPKRSSTADYSNIKEMDKDSKNNARNSNSSDIREGHSETITSPPYKESRISLLIPKQNQFGTLCNTVSVEINDIQKQNAEMQKAESLMPRCIDKDITNDANTLNYSSIRNIQTKSRSSLSKEERLNESKQNNLEAILRKESLKAISDKTNSGNEDDTVGVLNFLLDKAESHENNEVDNPVTSSLKPILTFHPLHNHRVPESFTSKNTVNSRGSQVNSTYSTYVVKRCSVSTQDQIESCTDDVLVSQPLSLDTKRMIITSSEKTFADSIYDDVESGINVEGAKPKMMDEEGEKNVSIQHLNVDCEECDEFKLIRSYEFEKIPTYDQNSTTMDEHILTMSSTYEGIQSKVSSNDAHALDNILGGLQHKMSSNNVIRNSKIKELPIKMNEHKSTSLITHNLEEKILEKEHDYLLSSTPNKNQRVTNVLGRLNSATENIISTPYESMKRMETLKNGRVVDEINGEDGKELHKIETQFGSYAHQQNELTKPKAEKIIIENERVKKESENGLRNNYSSRTDKVNETIEKVSRNDIGRNYSKMEHETIGVLNWLPEVKATEMFVTKTFSVSKASKPSIISMTTETVPINKSLNENFLVDKRYNGLNNIKVSEHIPNKDNIRADSLILEFTETTKENSKKGSKVSTNDIEVHENKLLSNIDSEYKVFKKEYLNDQIIFEDTNEDVTKESGKHNSSDQQNHSSSFVPLDETITSSLLPIEEIDKSLSSRLLNLSKKYSDDRKDVTKKSENHDGIEEELPKVKVRKFSLYGTANRIMLHNAKLKDHQGSDTSKSLFTESRSTKHSVHSVTMDLMKKYDLIKKNQLFRDSTKDSREIKASKSPKQKPTSKSRQRNQFSISSALINKPLNDNASFYGTTSGILILDSDKETLDHTDTFYERHIDTCTSKKSSLCSVTGIVFEKDDPILKNHLDKNINEVVEKTDSVYMITEEESEPSMNTTKIPANETDYDIVNSFSFDTTKELFNSADKRSTKTVTSQELKDSKQDSLSIEDNKFDVDDNDIIDLSNEYDFSNTMKMIIGEEVDENTGYQSPSTNITETDDDSN